jgi:hypothetical protein
LRKNVLFQSESHEKQTAGAKAQQLFCGAYGTTEQAAEKVPFPSNKQEKHTSVAKATAYFIGFIPGINPRPTTRMSFSASCEVMPFQNLTSTTGC